jgi:hypothetical protein
MGNNTISSQWLPALEREGKATIPWVETRAAGACPSKRTAKQVDSRERPTLFQFNTYILNISTMIRIFFTVFILLSVIIGGMFLSAAFLGGIGFIVWVIFCVSAMAAWVYNDVQKQRYK